MFNSSICNALIYSRVWRLSLMYLRVHNTPTPFSYSKLVGIGFNLRLWRFMIILSPIYNTKGDYIDYKTI